MSDSDPGIWGDDPEPRPAPEQDEELFNIGGDTWVSSAPSPAPVDDPIADAIVFMNPDGSPVRRRDITDRLLAQWAAAEHTPLFHIDLAHPVPDTVTPSQDVGNIRDAFDALDADLLRLYGPPQGPVPAPAAEPTQNRRRLNERYGTIFSLDSVGEEMRIIAAPPEGRLPPICRHELLADPPVARAGWMREVRDIREGHGMAMFGGIYLYDYMGDGRRGVYPGTIVIVAEPIASTQTERRDFRSRTVQDFAQSIDEMVHERRPDPSYRQHDLQAYVFLPDNVWYPIEGSAMRQRSGWHEAMRDVLRSWVILPMAGRIVRACGAAIAELDVIIAAAEPNATSPTWEEAHAARRQFSDIQLAVIAETSTTAIPPEMRATVQRNFLSWLVATATILETDTARVRQIVREELGGQPNTTESRPEPTAPPRPPRRIENRQKRNIRINRSRE